MCLNETDRPQGVGAGGRAAKAPLRWQVLLVATFFMSVDFAEESGSLIITVREDAEGSVEVVYDERATVLVTVVGGAVADVQILFSREVVEKLSRALARGGAADAGTFNRKCAPLR